VARAPQPLCTLCALCCNWRSRAPVRRHARRCALLLAATTHHNPTNLRLEASAMSPEWGAAPHAAMTALRQAYV
jgi:hypothetical protein